MNLSSKRGYTLIELLIVLGVAGGVGALLVPAFQRPQIGCPAPPQCQTNLEQLYMSLRLYADDERALPLVASANVSTSMAPFTRPFGWADAIHSYVRSPLTWQCPEQGTPAGADAARADFTDYWLNANLAGRSLNDVRGFAFLVGEGNSGRERTDARYALRSFPRVWAGPSSPSLRHSGSFSTIGFNGSMRWLPGEDVQRYNIFFSPRRDKRKYLPNRK